MTKEFEDKTLKEKDLKELNNQCEECKKEEDGLSNLTVRTYW